MHNNKYKDITKYMYNEVFKEYSCQYTVYIYKNMLLFTHMHVLLGRITNMYTKTMITMITMIAAIPPTTPPTIAPVLLLLLVGPSTTDI